MKISFEEGVQELEKITKILNEGQCTLRESESLYNKGILIQEHCKEILNKLSKTSEVEKKKINNKINKLSFEEAILRLNNISNILSSDCTVSDAQKLYLEGNILKSHCTKLLKNAEEKINTIADDILKKDKS